MKSNSLFISTRRLLWTGGPRKVCLNVLKKNNEFCSIKNLLTLVQRRNRKQPWRCAERLKGARPATFLSDAREPKVDLLNSWAVILNKFFVQIISIRVKTPSNTNLVAPRHIKREKGSLLVDLRRSKTALLKLLKDRDS